MANKKGRSKSKARQNAPAPAVTDEAMRAMATLYMAGYAHGAPQHHAAPPPAARGRSAGRAGGTKSGQTSRAASVTRDLTREEIIFARYKSAVIKYKQIGMIAGITYSRMDLLAKAYELEETHNTTPVLDALKAHLPVQSYYEKATASFPKTAAFEDTPLTMKEVTPHATYRNIIGKSLKYLHDANFAWDKKMSKKTLAGLIIQKYIEKNEVELVDFLTHHTTPSEDARGIAHQYFPKYSNTTEDYPWREYSGQRSTHPQPMHAAGQHATRSQHMHTTEHSHKQQSLVGADASKQFSSYETHYTSAAVPDEYRI